MAKYTYTIFDADPNSSSGTEWPSHTDVALETDSELETDSDEEAVDEVRDVMSVEAASLNPSDGYEVGGRIEAIVWNEDGAIVGQPTYDLTAEDLGIDKSSVRGWNTIASYVLTFPDDSPSGEGACDVEVQVGGAAGLWFVRTRGDAEGSDEADDTAYVTEEEAEQAAEAFAAKNNEAADGEDAEDYLRRQLEETAGDADDDGEYCVYWETSLDDAGPRERYATEEQATAAAALANQRLNARHPGGNLLCGFSVRALRDGEWTEVSS